MYFLSICWYFIFLAITFTQNESFWLFYQYFNPDFSIVCINNSLISVLGTLKIPRNKLCKNCSCWDWGKKVSWGTHDCGDFPRSKGSGSGQTLGVSCRDHFVYVTSQWETTLHCNVVSHWLGTYVKGSLFYCLIATIYKWVNVILLWINIRIFVQVLDKKLIIWMSS